jgi:hypothetical protein
MYKTRKNMGMSVEYLAVGSLFSPVAITIKGKGILQIDTEETI